VIRRDLVESAGAKHYGLFGLVSHEARVESQVDVEQGRLESADDPWIENTNVLDVVMINDYPGMTPVGMRYFEYGLAGLRAVPGRDALRSESDQHVFRNPTCIQEPDMYSGTRPIIGLLGSEVSGCTIASPSPFPALARSSCRSPSGLKCLGNERRFLPHIPQGALHLGHWVHVLDLVRVLARAGVHRLAPKVTVTCGHSLSRLVIGIQDISHRHPGH